MHTRSVLKLVDEEMAQAHPDAVVDERNVLLVDYVAQEFVGVAEENQRIVFAKLLHIAAHFVEKRKNGNQRLDIQQVAKQLRFLDCAVKQCWRSNTALFLKEIAGPFLQLL